MKSEQRSVKIFKDQTVHIGIDVHSGSYQVRPLYERETLGRSVRLSADPSILVSWARKNYPEAELIFGYEAGFSGLSLSRYLQEAGYTCHVLNAADIPSTEKDRVYKNDKRDSKKIAYALVSPYTEYNYQIEVGSEVLRQNVRAALRLNRDVSRLQHRLKQNTYYLGLQLARTAKGAQSWSKASRAQLRQQAEIGNHMGILLWLDQLELLLSRKTITWQAIDEMLLASALSKPYELLQTPKGIGPILAATLVTEIVDISRFGSVNKLRNYAGLTPKEDSSGENIRMGAMSKRGNKILRWALIQAARRMIDSDTEMAMRYAKWRKQCSHDHKAIIKVTNLILGRLYAIWSRGEAYQSPLSEDG